MNEKTPGGGGKRPPTLIDQALRAADTLVNEVSQRMPPDLVKQMRAGQRQIDQRISRLQSQLRRSASKEEVDRLARRIDELARQLDEVARAVAGRAGRPPRRDGPGRGPRSTGKDAAGRSGGTGAPSPTADKAQRRSTRSTAPKPEAGGAGTTPRNSSRSRTRKPPDSGGV